MKAAAEQFVIRLLPEDKAKVGAFNDKIEFARHRLHQRSRRARRRHPRARLRQRHAPVGRRRREPRAAARASTAAASSWSSPTATTPARSASQGKVIDRARADEVMIYAIGLESVYMGAPGRMVRTRPGRRAAEDRRRDRRRLLRAEEDRGARARPSPASPRSCTASTCSASRRKVLDGKVHKLEVQPKDAEQQGARAPQLPRHRRSISPRRAAK